LGCVSLGASLPELLGSAVVLLDVSPVLAVDPEVVGIPVVVAVGVAVLLGAPVPPVVSPPLAPVVVAGAVFAPVGPVVALVVVDGEGVGPTADVCPAVPTDELVDPDVVGELVELVPSPQPASVKASSATRAPRETPSDGFGLA
jgi:hypothetical protein